MIRKYGEVVFEAEVKLKERFKQPLRDEQIRKIIFWYDETQSYLSEVDEYSLEDVHTIKVNENNLIYTKYLIEKEFPNDSFLLYFGQARPLEKQNNPLLDIYFYSEEFKLDAIAAIMDELGLEDNESDYFFQSHASFFQNKKRQKDFRDLLIGDSDKSIEKLTLGIMCVLVKAKEFSFSVVCEKLFAELAQDSSLSWEQIEKFGKLSEFWEFAESKFHYHKEKPSLKDFLISIFVSKLSIDYNEKIPANWDNYLITPENNSVVFLNRWMNQVNGKIEYKKVAILVADELKFQKFLKKKSSEFLSQSDTFSGIEDYLVESTIDALLIPVVRHNQIEQLILNRRNSFWYSNYSKQYKALLAASRLLFKINEIEQNGMESGTEKLWHAYQENYYQIDTYYRHFNVSFAQLENPSDNFYQLQEKVENFYTNGFLQIFAEKWTANLNQMETFEIEGIAKQTNFYQDDIKGYVDKDTRVFVIISDALRYEIGVELAEELENSHYYQVNVKNMQGVLPSYTGLGMASLLPHQELEIGRNQIIVDGMSSQGLDNRNKIMGKNIGINKGRAFRAKDILNATKTELREQFSGGLVYYIYHNTIDATGDHAASEDKVFQAVETAKSELIRLSDKLVNNLSATHLYITADHGFMYTKNPLANVDKVSMPVNQSIESNRRFYIDSIKEASSSFHTFKLELANQGENFVHIPKGLMRIAVQGAGSNYVHGGSMPQECLIPLLEIKATSGRDTRKRVGIQLVSEQNRITNVVTYLTFLQLQRVTKENKSQTVGAYFEDKDKNKLSNEIILLADSISESPEDRITTGKFTFIQRLYSLKESYFFVLEDHQSDEELDRRHFTIDL
ncbi:TIGR02687 family protein [Carnobacterium iners]|uniref:TIGR02687 family protein n=1 Tax=Carnobacterium iners TaxID=1073423 RepID=A0A1X7MVM2_9LACT|nr:TIGR02687 family protein [Carnobacterium iners]SMH28857.1 TIGR02687 family protein [Carnobacterium iners]